MMVPNQSQHPWLPTDINPDSTWSFASQLRSAQFSRRIVAWRCVFFSISKCTDQQPLQIPAICRKCLEPKHKQSQVSERKCSTVLTRTIIRSWSPGYYTYQHTLVQQRPGLPDAAHLVETVPVPSHDDVGAVPLAPAAEANAGWLWRPARQAKIGQTNLPKDLQSSS